MGCQIIERSRRRSQDDALWHLSDSHQLPKRDEQLARQSDDHSLAGSAAAIAGLCAVPLRQCAVLLEHQEAPSQLDHATAHPGVARPSQSLLSPPYAALIRRTGQAGVTSDSLPVTQ